MRPFIRGRRAGRPGPRYGAGPWPNPAKLDAPLHAVAARTPPGRPDAADADHWSRLWLVSSGRDEQPKRPRDLT